MRVGADRLTNAWPWGAAGLSGLLGIFCFAPFNQSWLCWIALAPLIVAVWFSGENSKRRWLRNLLLGYVAGIVFFTGTFAWLGSLGILFANFWLRGLSLLLSVYLGLYFAFWACFIGLLAPQNFLSSTRNLLVAFFAASAWAALEWIRGWLFTGFGWNGLGVALHGNWALIQIAELTGVTGLSFVVALANVIAVTTPVRLFFEARNRQMRPHFDFTLTLAAIIALLTFGLYSVRNAASTRPIHISAIQANVPQNEKFDSQFTNHIFDRFAQLSDIALHSSPPPDLLVWPESSMPDSIRGNNESNRFVTQFSASAKTDLLLGTLDIEGPHDYNAAVLISGVDEKMQVYRKMHLVPFGEYVPLRHSFPLFAAVAGTWVPGDFNSGTDFTVFSLTKQGVRVAPLICFEDTVGDLVRRFVLNGATLLVDVTNDAWFLESSGSRQHLDNAIFRCVETRCPMARAANTGVTCFVNEFGRVTEILQDENGGTFNAGVLTGDVQVPQDQQLTFYARHGDLFSQICFAVALLTLIAKIAVH